MKIAAPRGIGNRLQHELVQRLFTGTRRITNSDGMDHHLPVTGDLRRAHRRHLAAGVVAVGEQDHQTFRHLAALKQGDRQADGITKHGLGSRHAHRGLIQHLLHHSVVRGKRQLHEGGRAEHDQSDAVVFAPRQKALQDLLHCRQVLVIHGTRQVDGQQQVAGRQGLSQRFLKPLGTRQRSQHQDPYQPTEQLLAMGGERGRR